ncbi:DNA replication complex GINS family protein [Candidatus Pacearchaeota archaeon]|nr:DNA replication complex GINS family protein [Candidatus Pacearchaeota archaeon]
MITYNDIYEAARKERYSDQLQPIPKNFIDEVSSYLKDKKAMASKDADEFSDVIIKTKKQLENAITLFKELILRRRKKILDLVLIASETGISKQDFENMLKLEKELFEDMMECIEAADQKLDGGLNGVKEEARNEMVSFKEDVTEFMNIDGERMGPFHKGDIANLPREIVKILIDDGKAVMVE